MGPAEIARRRKVLDRESARLLSQADQIHAQGRAVLTEREILCRRADALLGIAEALASQHRRITRRMCAIGEEARVLAQLWVERQ